MVGALQKTADTIAKEIGFLQQLNGCETSYDVFRLLKDICATFSFSHFSAINMPSSEDDRLVDLSMISNWPPELVSAYDELGLLKSCPIIQRLRKSTQPLVWDLEGIYSKRVKNNGDGEHNAAVELFRNFAFERGVYFSVHIASGELGAISFSGTRANPTTKELMELNFLSNTIFEKLKQFETSRAAPEFSLSPREQECLRWTAAGKTSAEIAIIIDLSEHTINSYLGSICQKLNAQNRAHAVSKAMRLSLLS